MASPAFLLAVAACSSQPGEITQDSEPFSDIAKDTSISALGTEPFWSLEIAPTAGGYDAIYSTPDNLDGSTALVTRFAGNNGLSFSGELEGQALLLAITPGACSDGMSDREFPYTATLALGDTTLAGCAYTSDEGFTGAEEP
ncbi:MAG: hypothetical protein AAF697_12415 [Pseudomonadota bacterium]